MGLSIEEDDDDDEGAEEGKPTIGVGGYVWEKSSKSSSSRIDRTAWITLSRTMGRQVGRSRSRVLAA